MQQLTPSRHTSSSSWSCCWSGKFPRFGQLPAGQLAGGGGDDDDDGGGKVD